MKNPGLDPKQSRSIKYFIKQKYVTVSANAEWYNNIIIVIMVLSSRLIVSGGFLGNGLNPSILIV